MQPVLAEWANLDGADGKINTLIFGFGLLRKRLNKTIHPCLLHFSFTNKSGVDNKKSVYPKYLRKCIMYSIFHGCKKIKKQKKNDNVKTTVCITLNFCKTTSNEALFFAEAICIKNVFYLWSIQLKCVSHRCVTIGTFMIDAALVQVYIFSRCFFLLLLYSYYTPWLLLRYTKCPSRYIYHK